MPAIRVVSEAEGAAMQAKLGIGEAHSSRNPSEWKRSRGHVSNHKAIPVASAGVNKPVLSGMLPGPLSGDISGALTGILSGDLYEMDYQDANSENSIKQKPQMEDRFDI